MVKTQTVTPVPIKTAVAVTEVPIKTAVAAVTIKEGILAKIISLVVANQTITGPLTR